MATISMQPRQLLVADDASDFAALQTHLDAIGYTLVGGLADRIDDAGALTITLEYPQWSWQLPAGE